MVGKTTIRENKLEGEVWSRLLFSKGYDQTQSLNEAQSKKEHREQKRSLGKESGRERVDGGK